MPKCLLRPEESTKLLGRSSDDRRKRFGKSRPNLWVPKNLVHRIVEFLNYWSRSSGGRDDSEPCPVFEASKINSAFPEGRNVGKFLQTLRTCDRKCAELPRLNLWCGGTQTQEYDWDLAP